MKQDILQTITAESAAKQDVPDVKIGQTIRVHYNITEGDKKRIQVFEGIVIARNNGGLHSTIRVRKVSFNIGVERIFPLHSPLIEKLEIVVLHKTRRAKLYYMREKFGKAARLKVKERYYNTSK
jgi:large subunit ribosomal protein L19